MKGLLAFITQTFRSQIKEFLMSVLARASRAVMEGLVFKVRSCAKVVAGLGLLFVGRSRVLVLEVPEIWVWKTEKQL